jgi:hypothetical protein
MLADWPCKHGSAPLMQDRLCGREAGSDCQDAG